MMRLTFGEAGDEVRERSREFLRSASHASITQHPDWPTLAPPSQLQDYRHFLCDAEGGQVVSAGLVRMTKILPGRYICAIRRGPVTRSPEDLAAVLTLLEDQLRRKGAATLVVNPYCAGADAAAAQNVLESAGYRRVPQSDQTLPTATAILDLTAPIEAISARLSQRRRRELRAGEKRGLEVRPVRSEAEALALNGIMREMVAETGMETDGQHDFVGHFRHLASNPDDGVIQVSYLGDTMVGGSVSYRESHRMFNLLMATSPSVAGVPRSTALYWSDIVRAKEMGCSQYDMVGFPDPELVSDGGAEGRGEFKAGFAPEIVKLTPMMVKALRPLDHALLYGLRRAYRRSSLRASIKPLLRGWR